MRERLIHVYHCLCAVAQLTVLIIVLVGLTLGLEIPKGELTVIVRDPAGAAVPKADITAKADESGSQQHGASDTDGRCTFRDLEFDQYSITVNSPGFKESKTSVVVESARAKTTVTVTMEVGAETETVQVTAEMPVISTDSTHSTQVSLRQIESIPINGRQFSQFILLVPATTVQTPISDLGGVSIGGNRSDANTFLVDGANVGDPLSNNLLLGDTGNAGGATPGMPRDSIQNMSVIPQSQAEYGGEPGGVVSVATRSGGNSIHGSFFERLRNEALDSRDFFNVKAMHKNQIRYNNFGASIGGPLKRDHLFGFVAYEGLLDNVQVSTLVAVPSQTDFARAIGQLGGDPSIPLTENTVVNPVIRNLFVHCAANQRCSGGATLWPQPLSILSGLHFNAITQSPTANNTNSGLARIDWHIDEKNTVTVSDTIARASESSPFALVNGDPLPNSNTHVASHVNVLNGYYNHIFSPTLLNDFRFTRGRISQAVSDEDNAGIGNPALTLGLNTGVINSFDFGLPEIQVGRFAVLGSSPYSNPISHSSSSLQTAEDVTVVHDNQEIKFGYELRHAAVDSVNDTNHRGVLRFASLADFLSGNILSGSISRGESNRTTSQLVQAAFVQDTYQHKSFTFSAGLRWDYFGALHAAANLFSVYDSVRGLQEQPQVGSTMHGNFSPRIGLSWSQGKLAVIAGAGLFKENLAQSAFIRQIQFNAFNPGVAYNPIGPQAILTSETSGKTLQLNSSVFDAATFSSNSRDVFTVGKIKIPYTISYTLAVQREVFSAAALELAYRGSVAHNLYRVVDINAPAIPGNPRPFANAAPNSLIAPEVPFVVNEIETNATSNFNSFELNYIQKRVWHGLLSSAHWRWSHSIDDSSSGLDWTPNRSRSDSRLTSRERASSNFDERHTVVGAWVYSFPSAEHHLLGQGWHISGNVTIRSGQPYQVNFANEFDDAGVYDFVPRPDITGDPFVGTSGPFRFLNLAAFEVPCLLDGIGQSSSHCVPGSLHFGDLPRNAFIGPRLTNIDLALSKSTVLNDKVTLDTELLAFNIANHPNFASPLLPSFIARAGAQGITPGGFGGANGLLCNTTAASNDCYLPLRATPEGALNGPATGGSRSLEFKIALKF